jgi:hypothetical protein
MPAAKNRAGQTCGAAKRPVAVAVAVVVVVAAVVIVIVIVIIGSEKVLGKEGTRGRAPEPTQNPRIAEGTVLCARARAGRNRRCHGWPLLLARNVHPPPGMNSLVCNYLS